VSRRAFDEAARTHVARFTPDRVGDAMLRSIAAVLAAPAPGREEMPASRVRDSFEQAGA